MNIIPVIDIRDGIVVHAKGGDRANYQPLTSLLTSSVIPEDVIGDLLVWYPFQQLYIADLDAIEKGVHHPQRYKNILTAFPRLNIWLDAGIAEMQDYLCYSDTSRLFLVLGSETLKDISLLEKSGSDVEKQPILSLDKKSGQLLGHGAIHESAYWTDRCIAMSLDNIGANQGPDFEWLKLLMEAKQSVGWYAAGGVRSEEDLEELSEMGVAGALIASALHTGKIRKSAIKKLSRDITLP
ncbi:MAG TPA: nickel transporter [Methylophaga aminisulfidivorans]|uniref:HisA/HisF-related TIM barrel protein n=1 Tax=Methylophaga TaxID=40222 RepID=UPI001760DBAC|nr:MULTISPECIES: HisA/HisF-related TIM barrel protein [Methylophaga]HIC47508.1 nickel transporter [Methylophaga sp.]HIM38366.1 nickel transporter [Methylophaga aminisulfidivorans]